MSNVQLDPQAQKELADLMVELSHDKDMRPMVNKFLKKKTGKVMPDVEIEDIRADVRNEFEKRDQDRAKKEALERLENQRSALKSRYDDAAIGDIEKTMEKLGISDYDVAARIYASETKPANPTYTEQDHRWEMPKIDIKDFGNLKQIGRQRAMQALDDIKRNRAS